MRCGCDLSLAGRKLYLCTLEGARRRARRRSRYPPCGRPRALIRSLICCCSDSSIRHYTPDMTVERSAKSFQAVDFRLSTISCAILLAKAAGSFGREPSRKERLVVQETGIFLEDRAALVLFEEAVHSCKERVVRIDLQNPLVLGHGLAHGFEKSSPSAD